MVLPLVVTDDHEEPAVLDVAAVEDLLVDDVGAEQVDPDDVGDHDQVLVGDLDVVDLDVVDFDPLLVGDLDDGDPDGDDERRFDLTLHGVVDQIPVDDLGGALLEDLDEGVVEDLEDGSSNDDNRDFALPDDLVQVEDLETHCKGHIVLVLLILP